jgi:hypothetical protein
MGTNIGAIVRTFIFRICKLKKLRAYVKKSCRRNTQKFEKMKNVMDLSKLEVLGKDALVEVQRGIEET